MIEIKTLILELSCANLDIKKHHMIRIFLASFVSHVNEI